jgi:eukaryotic-like serine/threonine-protein kinase
MPEWSVPGYTELKKLGSGGFGEVALARHHISGVLVAIKYLRPELLADPAFAEMFRGEARALASLDDPNVVRLYEYVESPSGAAIVMELVEGVSLREILAHQGATTPEAALMVLQGSLRGLAAAHRLGVVHRDYKPENVLVNGDGASKLTDFGLAARSGEHPIAAGTLRYAAPEQIDGATASPASDVYAATATFYECLTGHPPFSGEPDELLRQHHSDPVPLDSVPRPLRPLVAAGMAKNPQDRPANAASFVTELAAVASRAYGKDWASRGRSHLGEAALLLAALWPSGAPPAVQGTTVHRLSLRRVFRLRHLSPVKAVVAVGVAASIVAAGTALASVVSHRHSGGSHPPAAVHPVALGSSPSTSPFTTSPTPTSTPTPSPSPTPSHAGTGTGGTGTGNGNGTGTGGGSTGGNGGSGSTGGGGNGGSGGSGGGGGGGSGGGATVCEPDGTGCTAGGRYPDPDALISSDYDGFQVTWTATSVQPYSSGVPLAWTVGITYQNIEPTSLTLGCSGDWPDASFVTETMSGGDGNDGLVAASDTTCSDNPDWTATVPPGGTVEVYATFGNVPWPGVAVSITWGDAGTSAAINPFT